MGGSINASRHTRNDKQATRTQVSRKFPGKVAGIQGCIPRPDHGNGTF
jgi:hypothetical protein